jgi:hypothetical protein
MKCTIAALSTPSAIIASLFNISDTCIWNDSNVKLMEMVSKFVATDPSPPKTATNGLSNQLSELSAVIFKSIMSNGTDTARECAKALKVLAQKDPKAIHKIVAQHLNALKNGGPEDKETAAKTLVDSLVKRGKELADTGSSTGGDTQQSLEQLKRLIGMPSSATALPKLAPLPLKTSSSLSNEYSKQELLKIQSKLLPLCPQPPEELRNLRLSSRRK